MKLTDVVTSRILQLKYFVILSLFIEKQTIYIYYWCNLTPLICFYNNTWTESNFTCAVGWFSFENDSCNNDCLEFRFTINFIMPRHSGCKFVNCLLFKYYFGESFLKNWGYSSLWLKVPPLKSFLRVLYVFFFNNWKVCPSKNNNWRLSDKSNFWFVYLLVIFQ